MSVNRHWHSPSGSALLILAAWPASFPKGVSGDARTGKHNVRFDQRHVSKVRSVHDQVSRERLREEHSGGFRRVTSDRNFVKNSVKLCAEWAPKTSPDSDLSYRKQTRSRPYTCPVNRRVVGSSPTSGANEIKLLRNRSLDNVLPVWGFLCHGFAIFGLDKPSN